MAKAADLGIVWTSECSFTHSKCVIARLMCKYLFFGSTGPAITRDASNHKPREQSHTKAAITLDINNHNGCQQSYMTPVIICYAFGAYKTLSNIIITSFCMLQYHSDIL